MDQRPELTAETSPEDFLDFYWLKAELVAFCRAAELRTSGSKIELTERIAHYLKTGEELSPARPSRPRPTSRFDWSTAELTRDTIITDNYKNTQNVRAFFEEEIGPRFKFNTPFMNWMKSHSGSTLGEAIVEWERIAAVKKNRTASPEIAPQFEYNRYIRDFLADNPGRSRETAIAHWKIKKSQRGHNAYERSDLDFDL